MSTTCSSVLRPWALLSSSCPEWKLTWSQISKQGLKYVHLKRKRTNRLYSVCSKYSSTPTLTESIHSNVVKRGIVHILKIHAQRNSCEHDVASFLSQFTERVSWVPHVQKIVLHLLFSIVLVPWHNQKHWGKRSLFLFKTDFWFHFIVVPLAI